MAKKSKKAPTKFFTVSTQEKERAPLAFSTKKARLHGPEKKLVLKQYRAIDKKPLKLMTEEELRTVADLALKLGWKEEAIRFLTRLESLLKSTIVIKNLKLEVADINFDRGALKLSAQGYQDFLTLYPGDKKADYAEYKCLISNQNMMLKADRDQTPTYKTRALAQSLIEKNNQYSKDVHTILRTCNYTLYDHEVTVFEYYMKKGSTKAAETRLAALKKEYQNLLPDTQPKNLHMEYRLAQAKNDAPRANRLYAQLSSRFPGYATKIAHNNSPTTKKNYVAFF
ncbi:MAG: outer membrane assembly lipoprotein YfiO [Alteromonas naphthalenivorans]|jgi:outer membrane assembly lipoprotein YfiO